MQKLHAALACLLLAAPTSATSQQILFGDGWKEQRFSMFSSNRFSLNGDTLEVQSDDTVSLMWASLPQSMWNKRRANWDWTVERSVPATNLTKKGGDDRNLSLYFVFLPENASQDARNKGVMALMDNPDVRVLMYVWGGAHTLGQMLPSPILGARGRSIIRQAAGTGSAEETVDLAQDHRRAFGEEPQNLVGIAVSSDSDDTGSQVFARISRLEIE